MLFAVLGLGECQTPPRLYYKGGQLSENAHFTHSPTEAPVEGQQVPNPSLFVMLSLGYSPVSTWRRKSEIRILIG